LEESKRRPQQEHKVECQANADYEAYRRVVSLDWPQGTGVESSSRMPSQKEGETKAR
jgi:hypothetical protein